MLPLSLDDDSRPEALNDGFGLRKDYFPSEMKCVEVSDLPGFLFQKVVECHGEKRRGGQVLLDRLRLMGRKDSSGGLKVCY